MKIDQNYHLSNELSKNMSFLAIFQSSERTKTCKAHLQLLETISIQVNKFLYSIHL